jgi:amidohydrolase
MNHIYEEAARLFEFTRTLRRDFHRHPELGFQEERTSEITASELRKLGLEVQTGIAKTGVVAMIEGSTPGPVVLLRFDMDALPVTEETGVEYASVNPGVMHACGHDAHTAVGLSVARLLCQYQGEMAGSVKLVFQPAEEGLGGAAEMVKAGVLENPKPDAALALHVWNEASYGWLGATEGPVMAASETFRVKITGKGGHGAVPHLTVDPVLASAHVITALQSIVSRNTAPLKSAVVSVTKVQGGNSHNVIPPFVILEGTIRSFDPEVRQLVLRRFEEIVTATAEAFGCQVDVETRSITPAVINHPEVTRVVQEAARSVLPEAKLETNMQTMGSEDMAFMMQDIPGCYFFVGSADPENGLDAPHHHPKFNIDERSLINATAWMTAAALDLLKR